MSVDPFKKRREKLKEIHKDMLSRLNFDNKQFEKEAYCLFREMFDQIERKTEEWDLTHPEPRGLDGGFNTRKISSEYFARFEELKKKHNYHPTNKNK